MKYIVCFHNPTTGNIAERAFKSWAEAYAVSFERGSKFHLITITIETED